jgi:uncharacterized protein YgiM (DUF1202 family)
MRSLSIQGTRGFTKKEEKVLKKAAKETQKAMKKMREGSKENGEASSAKIRDGTGTSEVSTRYVVMSLSTPGLDKRNKHHSTQTTQTDRVEDDSSPDLDHSFSGWVTYAASTQLKLQVFDAVGKAPVLVGSATARIDGESMPEYDYIMNGEEEYSQVSIPLTWTNASQRVVPAGELHLRLIYVPAPKINLNAASMITKTWYFEATVLGMVFISMFVLALQSPAVPPTVLGQGAIRVLEIFVATHMLMELTMEVWVLTAARNSRRWWRDPWLVLAFLVLVCNWISIMAPSMEIGQQLEESPEERSSTGVFDDSEQTGARSAAAAALVTDGDLGGSYAVVLKKLISLIRVFRIVRPIRTLRMIRNVDVIVNVLAGSASLFLTVCGLLLFLLGIFALVGMSSFSGALQYECIVGPAESIDDDQPDCTEAQLLAADRMGLRVQPHGEACPIPCPHSLECSKHYKWCAPLQDGRREIGNDRFGFRDYDNFWRGIVTMFVQTTGDGGMHTMPQALYEAGVSNSGAAWVISFFGSVLLNLIALNLFLAVCCSAYSEIAAQSEEMAMQRMKWVKAKRDQLLRRETSEDRELREQQEADLALKKRLSIDEQIDRLDWTDSGFRRGVRTLIMSIWFERFTSTIIVGNTITMMSVYEGMDTNLKTTLGTVEAVFLVCFILEASLKFIGMGKTLYFRSKANLFDIVVISVSIAGYIATHASQEVRTAMGLNLESVQSLRAVRLLRALQVVRLLHRQKALIVVLKTIFRAWRPLLVHTFFCTFSMSMFAIIGMHVFGGSLGPTAQIEDYDLELSANFETFSRGFLTAFEMTVGEEWSHTMYWYSKYGSLGHGYWPWSVQLFFICMYVWMNCILFSLYVAMLLDNFSIAEDDKMPTQKRVFERQQRRAERKMRKVHASVLVQTIKESTEKGHTHSNDGSTYEKLQHAAHGTNVSSKENMSLYLFRLDHPLRLRAAKLQASPLFARCIVMLILFSCCSLALEGPGEGSPGFVQDHLGQFFAYVNVLVLAAFALEGLLKCVIHGFVSKSGPTDPYLQSKMNRLDFVIVVLCCVSYLPFVPVSGTWARALRLGRVITPLLNLTKNPEIKLVFISFVRAGPDTAVVLLPLILMGVVFSILGVATFGSTLKGCVDPHDPNKMLSQDDVMPYGNDTVYVHDNQTLCEAVGYEWASKPFNFDSCPEGMATLLVTMTDGAHSLMLQTTADNPRAVSYWVLFHLAFTCFFLNLFIGVLSASFEKSSGVAVRTIGEKQWAAAVRNIQAFRPSASDAEDLRPVLATKFCGLAQPIWWFKWRILMFKLSTNDTVENFWRVSIFANTVTLATDQYPIGEFQNELVTRLNLLFLFICTAEVVVKMTGFGFKHYFSSGWLISDLILVTVSISLRVSGVQSGVEVLRVMRVFRMIVLASKIPALVSLIDTLVKCLRASMALVLITSLIVYLYSIVGMNMFGLLPTEEVIEKHNLALREQELEPVREQELRDSYTIMAEICPHCGSYTDYTNFTSFFHAFRLLMQVAFGQELQHLITDMQYLGAGFWTTFIFFASFYCLAVWVCINLLIVTVLSNFDAATMEQQTGASEILVQPDLDGFSHCWASLTVGTHVCKPIEKTTPALLDHLQTYRKEEDEKHGHEHTVPDTVNFEDGTPSMCGTLTMRIQEVNGLSSIGDNVRPYTKLIACGSSMTSKLKLFTPTIKPGEDGTAVWTDKVDNDAPDAQPSRGSDIGNEMKVHITAAHTHIDFEVRNAFQFCDQLVGATTIDMEAIRAQRKWTQTFNLRADTASEPTLPIGQRDRWERMKTFDHYDQEHADEEPPDDGADTPRAAAQLTEFPGSPRDQEGELSPTHVVKTKKELKAEKRDAKIKANEEKKAAKQRKKAEKAARKLEKKLAKQAKKEAKRNKKKNKGQAELDEEPEEELIPHRFFKSGWEENGVKLQVEFEYEPIVSIVQKKTFLSDYVVRYAHKESNCGIEGWVEVSENGGKFKRRYCYIQQYPEPCFKMVRNATDVNMLEAMALRHALVVHKIKAEQIASLYNGHDKVAASTKRKNVSFQMGTVELRNNGIKEEAQIGQLSGIVVRAMELKGVDKPGGVPLIDEVNFKLPEVAQEEQGFYNVAGQFVQEEAEEEYVGNSIPDEDEIEVNPPEIYMAAKRVTLRAGASLDSPALGSVKRGEVVAVLATKQEGGILRMRFSGGWVSAKSATGRTTLMIPQTSTSSYFRIKRTCPVTDGVKLGEAQPVGQPLEKGDVVEALENTTDSDTGLRRIRIQDGWISEVDVNIKATPDPYCLLEIVPVLNVGGEPKNENAAVSMQTQIVEDDLTPDWNHGFDFKIFPSSEKLVARVYDANSRKPVLMGSAEMEIGDDGIPGPLLSGSCLSGGRASLSKETTQLDISLTSATGEYAGIITMDVNYGHMISRVDLVEARSQAGGDLSAAMMVDQTKESTYRFRAMSNEIRRSWLAGLRWVADGCQGATKDRLPAMTLFKTEVERLRHDVALLDLPFARVSLLLKGLYARRVMGPHKPTARRLLYTIFNLETFAWSKGTEQLGKKQKFPFAGVTLREIRGLHFHLVLERLCLLHYGKRRCLSYDQQMVEYQTEIHHASLHMMTTCVAMWVAKRRTGKVLGGVLWPSHPAWQRFPLAYQRSIEGVAATRMRCLSLLLKEIHKRSKPELMDVELPPREKLRPSRPPSEEGSGGMCKRKAPSVEDELVEDITNSTSPLALQANHKQESEEQMREALSTLFRQIDVDGGGTLDHDEVKEALAMMVGDDLEDSEVERMIRLIDDNMDGELDEAEFVEGMLRVADEAHNPDAEHHADDTDSDLDELDMSINELTKKLLADEDN